MLKIFHPKYFFYGLLLGAAGTMPGLSGGTMAFVLGIYQRLINAIAMLKPGPTLKLLFSRAWHSLLIERDGAFLALLILGKIAGIFLFSLFIPFLMADYPNQMNALFFGLLLASIPHVFSANKNPKLYHIFISLMVASGIAYIATMKTDFPITDTSFQFMAGGLALIAMLLPGVSGSFVLVLLGNYQYVFSLINRAFFFDWEAITLLIPFGLGALLGGVLFIGIIRYCFQHFKNGTITVLIGLMMGSLPGLWPFTNQEHIPVLVPSYLGMHELVLLCLVCLGLGISIFSLKAMEK